jgi:probable phosphoglycerate mutase
LIHNGTALLVVARHGESVLNALTGEFAFCPTQEASEQALTIPDHRASLTERGREQAMDLGRRFRDLWPGGFDVSYHSGYERAQETEALVRFAHGCGTPRRVCDPRLRERSPGYAYGMTEEQHHEHFPWMRQYYERTGWFLFRPPGGESLADLYEGRVRAALNDIMETCAGQRVFVMCHGRTMQVIRLLLEGHHVFTKKNPLPTPLNCEYVVYPSPSLP